MASKRKFRRTVIRVVVLTEDDTPYDPLNLRQVHDDITDGDAVGEWEVQSSKVVGGKAMSRMLYEVGSEPGFFQLDDNGNDADDDLEEE